MELRAGCLFHVVISNQMVPKGKLMNSEYFEEVRCNLCGSDSYNTIRPARRADYTDVDPMAFHSSSDEILQDPLVKCTVCGLQYVTPRVKPDIVLRGYSGVEDKTFISQAGARERTFKRCLNIVQSVWKKKPGRILDVGTAGGSFLEVAKDAGWEVFGCEPNKWLCKWCLENYGIHLSQGTLFDANFDTEAFDIVTLWDVLEHTADPSANLTECARLLKPGGLLVVNVPDIGTWLPKIMGSKWVFLVSVHYFYYTKQTIRATLEKSGFRILRVKPHIQMLDLEYILKRTIPYLGFVGKLMYKSCKNNKLGRLQAPYWIGQTLIIAVKPC